MPLRCLFDSFCFLVKPHFVESRRGKVYSIDEARIINAPIEPYGEMG